MDLPNTQTFLEGVTTDFVANAGRSLLDRWNGHQEWLDQRLEHGVDPYCKASTTAISTEMSASLRCGSKVSGVNFASQDYLNLSSHAAIHEAARKAIDRFGVHSAGSAALMGNTTLSVELEDRLAAFLGYRNCTVFPTGWGAGYGIIKTIVRPDDHIVIDVLAHACLQEGARNATTNVHMFPHLSNEAVARRLKRIRAEHPEAGILVVTETVFSMDSDVPAIAGLQRICREFDATLLVDVAHDMGAIGPTGRGYLEIQGLTGQPDILIGSFSKTFASNGGFVASNHPAMRLMLRFNCGPMTFTNAMSPVQASVVMKAIDIIEANEGAELRGHLMRNAVHMREALVDAGFKVLGQPSAIVPMVIGDNATSRLMTKAAYGRGGLVNLVEYPAVSRNSCRWRIQIMARHTRGQIDRFVDIAKKSLADATALSTNMTSYLETSPEEQASAHSA